jgi:50S ribosomal protein L16 3-hydroxylase
MRQLADQRALSVAQMRKVSRGAKDLLADWLDAGWLHTAKLKDQP